MWKWYLENTPDHKFKHMRLILIEILAIHGEPSRCEEPAVSFLNVCQTAQIFHLSLTNLDNYGHLVMHKALVFFSLVKLQFKSIVWYRNDCGCLGSNSAFNRKAFKSQNVAWLTIKYIQVDKKVFFSHLYIYF